MRRRQREVRGECPHLGLRHVAEREARARQLVLVEDPQEVGLVLVRIGGAHEAPTAVAVLEAGVVAGGDRIGSVGGQAAAQELVELDVLVAGLARVRGGAVEVGVDEGVDDPGTELALDVEDVERDPEQLGDAARVVGGIGRAAAAAELVALGQVAVCPHPDADDLLVARLLREECRRDR